MADKLGTQGEAIVNGAFEGRNAESIQNNFSKIFRRLRAFDATALDDVDASVASVAAEVDALQALKQLPQTPTTGDVLYYNGTSWISLAIGATNKLLTVVGGVPSWQTAATQLDYWGLQNQTQWAIFGRATPLAVGIAAPTNSATTTVQSNQTDSTYVSLATAAGAGSGAALIGLAGACQPQHDFTLTMVLRTGASITDIRIWMGLSTANFTNADDPAGASEYAAFRYSTVATDPGWVGTMRDATTQRVSGNVANIAINTRYVLVIRFISGDGCYFSVNGGAEVKVTLNPPSAAAALIPYFGIFTTAPGAGIKAWLMSRVHCRYGS